MIMPQLIPVLVSPAGMFLFKVTLLLIGATAAHSFLLRRNPRWRVVIWRAALAGVYALIPFSLAVPSFTIQLPPKPTLNRDIRSAAPGPNAANLSLIDQTDFEAAGTSPMETSPIGPAITASFTLNLLWGIVALVMVLRLLLEIVRVRSFLEKTVPADREVQIRCDAIGKVLGVRPPPVRLTTRKISPCIIGILRPVIVIPETMILPPWQSDLPSVLAHELAHIRSNDPMWIRLAGLLRSLLWFHPLVWFLRTEHLRACEETSDAVAAEMSGGSGAYAAVLARAFLRSSIETAGPVGLPFIRGPQVIHRVRALERGIGAPRLETGLVAPVLVAFVAGILSISAIVFAQSGPETSSAQGALQALHPEAVSPTNGDQANITFSRKDGGLVAGLHWMILDPAGHQILQQGLIGPDGKININIAETAEVKKVQMNVAGKYVRTIDFEDPAQISQLQIELPAALTKEIFHVSGRVLDPAGHPLAGVEVMIREEWKPGQRGIQAPNVQTDADGNYFYNGIEWPYLLAAEWRTPLNKGRGERFRGTRLAGVFKGNETRNLQFSKYIEGTSILSGHVRDDQGAPVHLFKVHIFTPTDAAAWEGRDEFFDSKDGTFEITGLNNGPYTVWVIPEGNSGPGAWSTREVMVDGSRTDVEFVVPHNQSHWGRVYSSPRREDLKVLKSIGLGEGRMSSTSAAEVGEDGYFKIQLNASEMAALKSGKMTLKIDGTTYPADHLGTNREEAKPISLQSVQE